MSKASLPQQVLPLFEEQRRADTLLQSYIEGAMSLKELLNSLKSVENGVQKKFGESYLAEISKLLDLKVHPKVYVVGRVFSEPTLAAEISLYFCEVDSDLPEIERVSSVERKILKGVMDFEKGREKIIRTEGKILGYPHCCIENYVESKRGEVDSAEKSVIVECIEKGYFDRLLKSLSESKLMFIPSLFTSSFFPCEIECGRAVYIGEEMLRWFSKFERYTVLKNAFIFRTMVNCLYLLATGYKSGVVDHKKLPLEFLDPVSKVISNITDFTNTLIVKIFGERMERERKQKD